MVLAYTFFKAYISKICNGFSLYIYIYIYMIQKLIGFRLFGFSPNNSFVTKIKNLDEHVAKNWTPIEIQFKN